MTSLDKQIDAAAQFSQTPFSDPNFQAFLSQGDLATGIKKIVEQITAAEKQAQRQLEQALKEEQIRSVHNHPLEWLIKNGAELTSTAWSAVVDGTRWINNNIYILSFFYVIDALIILEVLLLVPDQFFTIFKYHLKKQRTTAYGYNF